MFNGLTHFLSNIFHGAQQAVGRLTQPQRPQPQQQQAPNLGQFLGNVIHGAAQGVVNEVRHVTPIVQRDIGQVAHPVINRIQTINGKPIANAIHNVANTPLQGVNQLIGGHHTIGSVAKSTPVLGQAIKFGQQSGTPQSTTGNFVKGITKAGIQGAGYVAPELKIVKTAAGAGKLARVGAKIVNQGLPSAGLSVAGDVANGERNIKKIATNAALTGGIAAAPSAIKAAYKGVKNAYHPSLQAVVDTAKSASKGLSEANAKLGQSGHINFNTPLERNAAIANAKADLHDVSNTLAAHQLKINNARDFIQSQVHLPVKDREAAMQKALDLHSKAVKDTQAHQAVIIKHLDQIEPGVPHAAPRFDPNNGVHPGEVTQLDQQMEQQATDQFNRQPLLKRIADPFMSREPAPENLSLKQRLLQPLQNDRGSINLGAEFGKEKSTGPQIVGNKFTDSVKNSPEVSSEVRGQVSGQHAVRNTEQLMSDSRSTIQKDGLSRATEQALQDLSVPSGQTSDATLAHALEVAKAHDALGTEAGHSMAASIYDQISEHGVAKGQGVQILSQIARNSPEGLRSKAFKDLKKAGVGISPNEQGQLTDIAKGIGNSNNPTVRAIKELHGQAAEQIGKEFTRKMTARNAGKAALTPAEQLAKRINAPSPNHAKAADPIKDMVNTLHKVAKEVLPAGTKNIPRDPMELIGLAVKGKGEYNKVYAEARKLVEEKYKNNPKALEELNKYFNTEANRTYSTSQLNKGVQNALKGVDLSKLVKEHYTKVDQAGATLQQKLIKQAGLSESEASQLAGDIQARFKELTATKKEQLLNQMLGDKPSPIQKSAIQKLMELSNLGAFDNAKFANQINKKLGFELSPAIKKEIQDQIDAISKMPDGQAKDFAIAVLQKAVAKHLPQSLGSNAVSVWKAGLLSGVKTQEGNFVSNATFGGLKKASDPLAAGLDKLVSLKTGVRTKTLTNKGIISGTKEGLGTAKKTMQTGIDTRNIGDKYEQHAEINFGNKGWQKALAAAPNGIFRGMNAADQPFWYPALKNSLYDQAKADGINAHLKGSALTQHMDNLVKNPTNKMVETATAEANKATLAFDTVASKIISGAKQGIENSKNPPAVKTVAHAAIDILAPFTKVPSAFLSRTVDFTPLGIGRTTFEQIAAKKFDQRQLVQAISEGATGSGIVALGMALANSNMLSGDYPKNDPKEAARWKTEGITANSIKLGGKWYSLNYMGPLGLLFNAGNKIAEAGKSGANASGQLAAAMAGLGQGLMGQSFLQGFSGFSNAIQDPARNATSFLHSQIASVVPNIVNDIRNLTDPMQRQANSTLDAVKNKIPGLSTTLQPKIDAFGNDLSQPSSGADTALNPFKPSNSVDSPMLSELNRLGQTGKENLVFPTEVKTIGSGKDAVKLTPDQATQRQKLLGSQLTPLWNSIMSSPEYAKLDDAHKALALKAALTDVTGATDRTVVSQVDPSKLTKPATGNVAKILSGHPLAAADYIAKVSGTAKAPKTGKTPRVARTKGTGVRRTARTKIARVAKAKTAKIRSLTTAVKPLKAVKIAKLSTPKKAKGFKVAKMSAPKTSTKTKLLA